MNRKGVHRSNYPNGYSSVLSNAGVDPWTPEPRNAQSDLSLIHI